MKVKAVLYKNGLTGKGKGLNYTVHLKVAVFADLLQCPFSERSCIRLTPDLPGRSM